MSEGDGKTDSPDGVLTLQIAVNPKGESIGQWVIKWRARVESCPAGKLRNWLTEFASRTLKDTIEIAPSEPVYSVPTELEYRKLRLPGDPKRPARKEFEPTRIASLLLSYANQIALDPDDEENCETVLEDAIYCLSNELFCRAMNGSYQAQRRLKLSAVNLTDLFVGACDEKAPGIIESVGNDLHVPGLVSINPEVNILMRDMCKKIGQGRDYKVNIEGVKSSKFDTPKHRLADVVCRYIDSYRDAAERETRNGRLIKYEGLLDSRVCEICSLPPLEVETVSDWVDAIELIVGDATGGDELNHPAFKEAGPFGEMFKPDKRGEFRFRKGITEALKERIARSK